MAAIIPPETTLLEYVQSLNGDWNLAEENWPGPGHGKAPNWEYSAISWASMPPTPNPVSKPVSTPLVTMPVLKWSLVKGWLRSLKKKWGIRDILRIRVKFYMKSR